METEQHVNEQQQSQGRNKRRNQKLHENKSKFDTPNSLGCKNKKQHKGNVYSNTVLSQ